MNRILPDANWKGQRVTHSCPKYNSCGRRYDSVKSVSRKINEYVQKHRKNNNIKVKHKNDK